MDTGRRRPQEEAGPPETDEGAVRPETGVLPRQRQGIFTHRKLHHPLQRRQGQLRTVGRRSGNQDRLCQHQGSVGGSGGSVLVGVDHLWL